MTELTCPLEPSVRGNSRRLLQIEQCVDRMQLDISQLLKFMHTNENAGRQGLPSAPTEVTISPGCSSDNQCSRNGHRNDGYTSEDSSVRPDDITIHMESKDKHVVHYNHDDSRHSKDTNSPNSKGTYVCT